MISSLFEHLCCSYCEPGDYWNPRGSEQPHESNCLSFAIHPSASYVGGWDRALIKFVLLSQLCLVYIGINNRHIVSLYFSVCLCFISLVVFCFHTANQQWLDVFHSVNYESPVAVNFYNEGNRLTGGSPGHQPSRKCIHSLEQTTRRAYSNRCRLLCRNPSMKPEIIAGCRCWWAGNRHVK